MVIDNASATKPAKLWAIFDAEDGVIVTTRQHGLKLT
jgi:hypothetical protein